MKASKFTRRLVPAALPTTPPAAASRLFKPAPLPVAQDPQTQLAARRAAGERRIAAAQRAINAQSKASLRKGST